MKKLLAALTICSTLALSACGGDDGDGKSDALTKAELIKQGDKICKDGSKAMDAAEAKFADPDNPTAEEIDAAVDSVVVPTLKDELEQLRDLEPPADDEDEIDSMLDSLEKAIADIEKDWRTGLGSTNIKAANKKATDYGFKKCGEE
jgi:hypothetical protein